MVINGKTYVVEDRGGAIQGNRIDVYMNSHAEAIAWGVRYLDVEVINKIIKIGGTTPLFFLLNRKNSIIAITFEISSI